MVQTVYTENFEPLISRFFSHALQGLYRSCDRNWKKGQQYRQMGKTHADRLLQMPPCSCHLSRCTLNPRFLLSYKIVCYYCVLWKFCFFKISLYIIWLFQKTFWFFFPTMNKQETKIKFSPVTAQLLCCVMVPRNPVAGTLVSMQS